MDDEKAILHAKEVGCIHKKEKKKTLIRGWVLCGGVRVMTGRRFLGK